MCASARNHCTSIWKCTSIEIRPINSLFAFIHTNCLRFFSRLLANSYPFFIESNDAVQLCMHWLCNRAKDIFRWFSVLFPIIHKWIYLQNIYKSHFQPVDNADLPIYNLHPLASCNVRQATVSKCLELTHYEKRHSRLIINDPVKLNEVNILWHIDWIKFFFIYIGWAGALMRVSVIIILLHIIHCAHNFVQ